MSNDPMMLPLIVGMMFVELVMAVLEVLAAIVRGLSYSGAQ